MNQKISVKLVLHLLANQVKDLKEQSQIELNRPNKIVGNTDMENYGNRFAFEGRSYAYKEAARQLNQLRTLLED